MGSASVSTRRFVSRSVRGGEQCIVPLRVAFALADSGRVVKSLFDAAQAATNAAEAVKTCVGTYAAAKGAKTASNWLISKNFEINIIGMKWRLDCEKGEKSQCIRAEGLTGAVFDIVATIAKTGETYKVRGDQHRA